MNLNFIPHIEAQIKSIEDQGFSKKERIITSPQNTSIQVSTGESVLNFCANNYLGLADHPVLIDAAKKSLEPYCYWMASVRFICGTREIHKTLEAKISSLVHQEYTILYSSCFDANGGLFETLLTEADAIISDELNHASIIDGVRLCKAKRYRYQNNNMADLRAQLEEADAAGARFKLIATDGVFSMDGIIANLKGVCDLADEFNALVMVDDSHAIGFMGENGGGTPEHCGVADRVDIVTGTLGKALGGASGGYTSAKKQIVRLLRERSRPYLFSNALAPVVTATAIATLNLLDKEGGQLRARLEENKQYFREKMSALGFDLVPGEHPIIPVMLGDAKLAANMADLLLKEGVYVIGFSYPVVPMGRARIRVQMSAAHTREQLDCAIAAFYKVGRNLGVIAATDAMI